MPPPDPNLLSQLSSELQTRYHLPVSQSWLIFFLQSTRQPLPPFAALLSTAHFRLLNSDISVSLAAPRNVQSPTLLPPNASDVAVKEFTLRGNVPIQILDIVDVGVSNWSQVEAIERIERGEEVRGREVIRSVPGMADDDDDDGGGGGGGGRGGDVATGTGSGGAVQGSGAGSGIALTKRSQGPHKLILQDADKQNIVAFELVSIPKLWIGEGGIGIGCKMILKTGTLVRRGMVMLQPQSVVLLGGKVDSWDKKWRADRKKRLIDDAEGEHEDRRDGS